MKHVRRPWMIRAAFAVIGVGLILIGYFVAWMWLYRTIVEVAPSWMLADAFRGNASLLNVAGTSGFVLTATVVAFASLAALFRLLRVPDEAFLPGDEGRESYPFHRRRLSAKARAQPGQEAFFDEKLRQVDQFSRSPLSPPVRKRD